MSNSQLGRKHGSAVELRAPADKNIGGIEPGSPLARTVAAVVLDDALPAYVSRPQFPLFGAAIPLPPSLKALAHRNFRLFWSGQLISLIGTWMQNIARAWLVFELTHSAFWLGMVGFANSIPVLFLSLWGGVVADRVSKRVLVIWTQAISMVMALVLAVLTLTGAVELWHVLAVSVILGTVFAFDGPARQSFTVEMVGKDDLMNAVALNSAIFNGARVLGPAIGAVALATAGAGWAFLLNGISYLAVIYGLLRMQLPYVPAARNKESTFSKITEGVQYVRRHTTIGLLMGIVAVVSVFAFPYTIMMPIFADSVLRVGQEGYGTLMTFSGIGSLIGALSLTVQSGKLTTKRGRIVLVGSVLLPVTLGIFSLSGSYLLSIAMLIGVGYSMISVNSTINTIIQTEVPDELRGRVNGLYSLLFIGVAPLGNLQAGLLADWFGAPASLFLGSVAVATFTLYVLLTRRQVFTLS